MESSIEFLFDECLSPQLAKAVTHCGKKHVPQIVATSLCSKNARGSLDIDWVRAYLKKGIVGISEDCSMVSDHDIARIVADTDGVLLLLRPEVSQRRRWGLLKWYMDHLPKLARSMQGVQSGTTWWVNKDGHISRISPSLIKTKTSTETTKEAVIAS